jgi:TATA-binding protein-associated factor
MILKYTIAAASSSSSNTRLNQIITLTFPNIIKCIQDTDDDVRQVASSSLEPISTRLNSILADSPSNIELLIRTLIDVLSDLDDLGTSCSSVMSLLSDLLTLESNRTVFIRLLNGESILPRLMPFLSHSSTSVRQTTMSTIDKIVRAINAGGAFKFEELEKHEDLATLMRLLYQQAILMSSDAGFKLLEPCLTELWTTLCEQLSPKCLIAVCFPFITTWLVLMMYPSNQAIESVCLVP